jgi:uncharacterized membrane protein YgcG
MRARCAVLLSTLFALLACAGTAGAQERILDYHSDIAIATDGSLDVTEYIRVVAEGDRIRHGIYRDFPTDYRDRQHNRYVVGFEALDATLDGAATDWHSERRGNGVRVYLGDKDTVIPSGEHTFTLHYRVTRELGFFADHDALFWNVNGTGWDFDIARASASVRLPVAVPADQLKAAGYTGAQGSTQQALTATVQAGGADYATTRALGPGENLSIVLDFPKGVVVAPTASRKATWLLHDNRNLLWGLLGLVVLWAYYLVTWNRHGRDPAAGPKVATYEPPDGDSAAALRFVRRMGYDNTCFTAGILGVAAKGGLTIQHREDKKWLARRAGSDAIAALTGPEKALRNALFEDGDELVFEQANHARVQAASKAFKVALKAGFEKKYFLTNYKYLLPGLAITVATAWLASLGGSAGTAGMILWLAGWSCGVAFLLNAAIQAGGGKSAFGAWFMVLVFALGEVVGLIGLAQLAGYATIPIFLALIATNIAFYFWMRAPTQLGVRLLDRINGFRWYLGVAEKQELDARYRPESRPDLFATYLPYALALGVGNAWAERFAEALTPAQMQAAQPAWYAGSTGGFTGTSFASFTSDLSSGFAGAIASSSVAPGSGAGGGFSGGGGGGGGGGGW